MRLEALTVQRDGERMRRTAELSWIGGEATMSVEVPGAYAPADTDISPFVPVALLASMMRAEPLQIDGAVSPKLLHRLPDIQELASSWNTSLRRIRVRASATQQPGGGRLGARACFYSRGVDSTYSVSVPRAPGDELSCLVHWRDFQPEFGEATRARGAELVQQTADELIGLPLVIVDSDVMSVLIGLVDLNDATSAMLSTIALSLPGLAGRFLIPSALGYSDLLPVGTHPLLDHMWSTERVAIEHDSNAAHRDDKVAWICANRPDLLQSLHVCLEADSNRNCGHCRKCVWTMLLLHINGRLNDSSFPTELDPKIVRDAPRKAPYHLTAIERIYARLGDDPTDAVLKKALRDSLRDSARWRMPASTLSMIGQYTRRLQYLLRGALTGVPIASSGTASAEVAPPDPSWPPRRDAPPGQLGLVRAVDRDLRCHRYAAGALPPGERTGELGALLAERPADDAVPLVLDAEARPRLERRTSPWAAARWVAEPIAWRRQASVRARARSSGRRVLDAVRTERRGRHSSGTRVGWLHGSAAPGRTALWSAAHPVLDDVLLTTDPDEARVLGYGEPALLGYLEDSAPLTGIPGPAAATIPWARHWGRRT